MAVISSNEPRIVVTCFNQISNLDTLNYCIGSTGLNSQHNLFRKFEDRVINSIIYIFWHFFFIKFLVLDCFLVHIHSKMRKSCHKMGFDLRSKIRFSFEVHCVIVEIRAELPRRYFIQLQCLDSFSKPVFNVTKTFNVQKVSLIMVESKADLASVRVFR
jgi:hypothetical protein